MLRHFRTGVVRQAEEAQRGKKTDHGDGKEGPTEIGKGKRSSVMDDA
jgi:hypothetical protein